MSCRFYLESAEDTDEPNLWWPANNVARLFKANVETLAELLGVPSGIGDLIEDECEVDLVPFQGFCTSAVARYDETTNGLLRSMTVGLIATALALLQRAGGQIPSTATSERQAAWASLSAQHEKLMPR